MPETNRIGIAFPGSGSGKLQSSPASCVVVDSVGRNVYDSFFLPDACNPRLLPNSIPASSVSCIQQTHLLIQMYKKCDGFPSGCWCVIISQFQCFCMCICYFLHSLSCCTWCTDIHADCTPIQGK